MKKNLITSLLIFAILISSCSLTQKDNLVATKADIVKVSPTRTPRPQRTEIPTMTLDPTQGAIATLSLQFPVTCDNFTFSTSLSPNKEWLATSCETEIDQKMIVQNSSGESWKFDFNEYAGIVVPEGELQINTGEIVPTFWSPDGKYLYFSTYRLGGCGGDVRFCYTLGNALGLFRLDLNTGDVVTLIDPEDSIQYLVEFSPTGEYYSISHAGITIVDTTSFAKTRISDTDTFSVAWSPDGRYLAYATALCGEDDVTAENSKLTIYDSQTGEEIPVVDLDGKMLIAEEWTDNTHFTYTVITLNYVEFSETLYSFNLETKIHTLLEVTKQ